MSRVLLAWELGSNFGHLALLLPLARDLRGRGHDVLFVVKDPAIAGQMLANHGFSFVSCPRPVALSGRRREPVSFADILAGAGFADEASLYGLVLAWHSIFTLFRPDVLVAEYAPSALFAAKLSGLPCLQVTNGFNAPPVVTPYPCFRPWLRVSRETLLQRERELGQTAATVCNRLKAPVFADMQSAIHADATFLATFPELDHYRGRQDGMYIGGFTPVDEGLECQWLSAGRPRLFAYLRPSAYLAVVLENLRQSEIDLIACIPGIDTSLAARFGANGWQLRSSMIKLGPILESANLVLSYAGHGLVVRSLFAGVPLLMIPGNIEQWLLSVHVQRQQMGRYIEHRQIERELVPVLRQMLSDSIYSSQARQFARKYEGERTTERQQQLIDSIENLQR